MKGDSCTQRETGLLLTPESPELDILRSHAEICHDKSPETSWWAASNLYLGCWFIRCIKGLKEKSFKVEWKHWKMPTGRREITAPLISWGFCNEAVVKFRNAILNCKIQKWHFEHFKAKKFVSLLYKMEIFPCQSTLEPHQLITKHCQPL